MVHQEKADNKAKEDIFAEKLKRWQDRRRDKKNVEQEEIGWKKIKDKINNRQETILLANVTKYKDPTR